MAVVTTQQSVAALYTAIFNRAPDQAGLNFWTAQINGGASFATIAEGFAQHEVFTTGIGALPNADYVNALYTNILGSAGDAAGIAYWTARLAAGESKASVVASFVEGSLTIDLPALLAAGSLTQADYDLALVRQQTLTNKADVGIYFANTLGAASNLNPATVSTSKAGLEADPIYKASQAAIAGVDSTGASVKTAQDAIAVAAGSPNPAQALLGQTFTLTAGIDNLVGDNGNNTIVGAATDVAGGTTIQSGDVINGGAGTDTLRIVASNTAVQNIVPTLTSVENVEYQGFAAATNTLNLTTSSSVEKVSLVNGNSSLNVTNAASIVDLAASNTTAGGILTVNYTAAAVAGTADVQAISLNNTVGTEFVVNGVETFNIAAVGANTGASVFGNAVTTVNVSGAGSLVLANPLDVTMTTFNAAANTGGVTATFSGGNVTATGGAGNDTFNFGAGLTATAGVVVGDVVNGGAGIDTVRVTTGGNLELAAAAAPFSTLTSIERVAFDGVGVTLNGATFNNVGITNIALNTVGADVINNAGSARTYEFGAANTDGAQFNMSAGSTTLNLDLLGTVGTTPVAGVANTVEVGALAITPAGVASATNVTAITLSSLGNFTAGTFVNTTGGTEVVSLTAGTFNSVGAITAASGSTLTLDGNAALDIAGSVNNITINASALTGSLVVQGSAFVGELGAAAVVGVGGVATAATNTGVDTITLGSARDVVQFSANGSDSGTIQITGTAATAAATGVVLVDTINGFTAGANGDVLDIAGTPATYTALAAASQTAISALSGADATLLGAANVAANGNVVAGWTAFAFQGQTYALYEAAADATGGFVNADTLVQLSGVSAAALTVDNFA